MSSTAAAGGEILALTNAALMSLNSSGVDFAPAEASPFSHSIFSPIGAEQATNVPTVGSNTTTKNPKEKDGELNEDQGHRSSPPSSLPYSLSPLTISARDIEGGSLDFTEFCNGNLDFSEDDDRHKINRTRETLCQGCVESSYLSVDRGHSTLSLAAPQDSSSPSVPIQMRVSASKLREIPSPHLSLSKRSTSTIAGSPVSVSDSFLARGTTPRVQSAASAVINSQSVQEPGASKAKVCPQVWNKKSLRQGILLAGQGADGTLNSSGDSVIISDQRASSSAELRQSRMKLVEETSRCKNVAGIDGYASVGPQQVQLVRVSRSKSAYSPSQARRRGGEGGSMDDLNDGHRNFQPPDVMETAKLVATCTAAATAALLASADPNKTSKKPSGGCVSTPVPSPASNRQQRVDKSLQTSLPATKSRARSSVLKNDITLSYLKQNMDKYSHKESSDTHLEKQSTTTARAPAQPNMLQENHKDEKEGPSSKSLAESSSESQEPLLRQSMHHRDGQVLWRKGVGEAACLHPSQVSATEGLAKKRNCKRHSYHSAPTQNSETVAAALIDTKTDFISKRAAKRRPLSPSIVAHPEAMAPTQLMDVLKRVQQLEDLQHIHNMELAKSSNHPTSLPSNGAHKSASSLARRRRSVDTDHRAYPVECVMNKSSHNPLQAERPSIEDQFGVLGVTGPLSDNCFAPVEDENGDHKRSGATHTMQPPSWTQRGRKDSFSLPSSDKVADLDNLACPKSGYSHHTGVPNKAKSIVSESMAINTELTTKPQTPDLPDAGQGADLLVQAQKVLGTVQSAKQELEIQGEFEETERTFDNFVKALGSKSDDGCQGISWTVSEFLSNLSLSGTVSAEVGKHGTHNIATQHVDGKVGTQQTKRSKRVMFSEKSLPHVSTAPCPPRLTTTTCDASTLSSSNLHRASKYSDPSSRRWQMYPTLGQDLLQASRYQAGVSKVSDAFLPPQPLSLPSNTEIKTKSEIAFEGSSELASAVPLGAPCLMPSPHYTELDGPSVPSLIPSPCSNELDCKQCSTSTFPEVQSGLNSEQQIETESSKETKVTEVGLEGEEEEGSVCSKTSLVPTHQQLENSITESNGTLSSEVDETAAISISGAKQATPPPQHSAPVRNTSNSVIEAKSVTSEELDRLLQEHLETQATQWIERELMARMLAQVQRPLDPIPPHCQHTYTAGSPLSSFRTNSTSEDDVVGSETAVNESIALQVVKDVMKEKLGKLLQEITHDITAPLEENHVGESGDDYSYTTPDSVGITTSSTSSLEEITLVPTPQPTPSQLHSPTPHHTPEAELQLQADLTTPTATPPLSFSDEEKESFVSTPQATEEDVSTSTELDVLTKSIPSASIAHDEVPTPSATPASEAISLVSFKSQETNTHLMVDKSQQVTPVQEKTETFSESLTTSSSSHEATSSSATTTGDREISLGEIIPKRPRVPLALVTSLSEGEIPHSRSPGEEVPWYAMYTARMKQADLINYKDRSKRKLDLTRVSSPDPTISDSSNLSDNPQKVHSIGEVRQTKKGPRGDSLDKLISRLNILSPENSSTPAGHDMSASNDTANTLSEMPSIRDDHLLTPATTRHKRSAKKITVVPYPNCPSLKSKRNGHPTSYLGRLSPGEVPRHIHDLHVRQNNKREAHSTKEEKDKKKDALDYKRSGSPEINTLRDGIDVINISRHDSDGEHKSESSLVDVNEPPLVQPVTSTSRIQVVEVKSCEEEAAKGESNKENKIDSDISDCLPSSKSMESKSAKELPGSTQKLPMVVIPTAEVDTTPSIGNISITEDVDLNISSDFDLSSISIPGF